METSLKGKILLQEPLRAVSYGMENHFYHIGCPPLNVAIFITHVHKCVMGATHSSMDLYFIRGSNLQPLDILTHSSSKPQHP